VADTGNKRLVLFTPAGDFVRVISFFRAGVCAGGVARMCCGGWTHRPRPHGSSRPSRERYAEIARFIDLKGSTTEELVDALIAELREKCQLNIPLVHSTN